MESCVYKGTIKGEPIQLFEDIKKITNNRELASKVLAYAQSEDIKSKFSEYPVDRQGNPTLEFLMSKWPDGWRKRIDFNNGEVRKAVADYSGFTNEIGDHTEFTVLDNNQKNWNTLQSQTTKFNNSNPLRFFYKARVGLGGNNRINGIKVNLDYIEAPLSPSSSFDLDVKNKIYNEKVNSRIRTILQDAKVSIGAINELEQRIGANGVFDSSKLDYETKELVELIRLAPGINGEKALPEEFAHFAVEALIDSPLIKRAINYIQSNESYVDTLGDSYSKYNELYEGNKELLAKEALGKMLASNLVNTDLNTSLFDRIINLIKNFFQGLKDKGVDDKILSSKEQIEQDLGKLSTDILSNKFKSVLKASNIRNKVTLNSLEKSTQDYSEVLDKIIQTEIKKYNVFSERNYKFDKKQKQEIINLQKNLADNEVISGINTYTERAIKDLKAVQERFDTLTKTYTTSDALETAKTLRMMKDYVDAYKETLELLQGALNSARNNEDTDFIDKIQENVKNLNNLTSQTDKAYKDIILPLFAEFASKFVDKKALTNPFQKDENGNFKTSTLEELLKESQDGDIGILDKWFSALSNSNDASLRLFDSIVKDSHENKRLRAIDAKKALQAAQIELEKSGIKDTKWVHELDNEGIPTGKYISEIKYYKFQENLKEAEKKAEEVVKSLDSNIANIEYKKIMAQWYRDNMDTKDDFKTPKLSIYGNTTYNNLSEAQHTYLKTIKETKELLDSYLPDKYKQTGKVPFIRKDELERFLSNPKDTFIEGVKDKILRREDDDEFGTRSVVTDFEGKEVKVIPVYFTSKLDNMKDLSLDATSNLIAYADMAINFDEMNKVIDMLEIGHNVINAKQVTSKKGGKVQEESIRSFGQDVKRKLTKKGVESNIGSKLEGYLDAQVYGELKVDQGTIGNTKIDKAKLMDTVSGMTATYSLGLNVLQGIGNVVTGKTLAGIEALSGQYINVKNLAKGDKYYGQGLLDLLGEVGNRVKISKLNLFIEKFDCLNGSNSKNRDINMDRKTWLARGLKLESLQFMSTCGEHYMQTRTYLALADRYKMLSPEGKEVPLYEALESKYIDDNNKNKGATLEVKEGYTKLDGTQFTKEDVKDFTLKGREINNRLHGLHNKADLAEIQRYAEGRMIMLFRKWIPIAISQRYGQAQYNYALGEWTEGYYRTTGKFLLQTAKDLRKMDFYVKANWDKLNPTEKSNVKRASIEMGVFLASALAIGLIDFGDKDRPWLAKMLEYQLYRINNEMAFYTPTPAAITQGLQIVQSPTANIGYAQRILKIISLKSFQTDKQGDLNGPNWILQAIPTYRSIEGAIDPSTRLTFFKH